MRWKTPDGDFIDLNWLDTPTLQLNAQNDPFLPAHALTHEHEVSAKVTPDYPREGSHVGFVSGSLPGRLDWLPQRLLHFSIMQTN